MIRSSWLYPVFSLLVAGALLCSGCSIPGQGTSGGNGGLTDITVYTKERSTLDEAMEAFRVEEQEGLQDVTGMELTQILGIRVDQSGSARTWTLGFRDGNRTRILEYTAGRWTGVEVQLPLPDEPIPLDQLMLPQKLFEIQKKPIDEAFSRHGVKEGELMIRGETCTFTVPSPSGTTVLTFDARTGGLRSSP
jgi:hypothetical protein